MTSISIKTPLVVQMLAEIKETAQRWYDQQLARAEQAHGDRWPEHREWVEIYIRAEVRERLIARGWRASGERR
jgi:hypothetical protein